MSKKGIRIFKDATVVITGGASGIGKALGENLAGQGADIVLADLQFAEAKKNAAELNAAGGRVHAVKLDVSDFNAFEKIIQATVKRTGRIDYLFNNAGINVEGLLDLYKIEDWNLLIDVNMRGAVNGVQAVYNIMTRQGFGHIVNTASITGLISAPNLIPYSMTKHALVGLSKSLRAAAAHRGIRVSVLCPGLIKTSIVDGGGKHGRSLSTFTKEQRDRIAEEIRMIEGMEPEAFARKALSQVVKNRSIIIVPGWWKLFWYIDRISPDLAIASSRKRYEKGLLKVLEIVSKK